MIVDPTPQFGILFPNSTRERATSLKEVLKYLNNAVGKIQFRDDLTIVPDQSKNQISLAVAAFLSKNKDLADTVSPETVDARFRQLVISFAESGQPLTERELGTVLQELQSHPVLVWDVFRPLGGVIPPTRPVQLGPFKVTNWKSHLSYLSRTYSRHWRVVHWEEQHPKALVSVKVRSREERHALAKADERFRQFENTARYILSGTKYQDIGIFDFSRPEQQRALVVSSLRASGSYQMIGALVPVDIADKRTILRHKHNRWVWELLKLKAPSPLQSSILMAVDWVGKGLRDTDPSRRFMQVMIALESLLQITEKGQIVSPSIAHQLSEWAAYLVGVNQAGREQTERKIKELYGIRSAIAHGGKGTVNTSQVSDALTLIKFLIQRLATDPRLSRMQTKEELRTWITKVKYSSRLGTINI